MSVSLETKCLHLVEEENTEDECKKSLHCWTNKVQF